MGKAAWERGQGRGFQLWLYRLTQYALLSMLPKYIRSSLLLFFQMHPSSQELNLKDLQSIFDLFLFHSTLCQPEIFLHIDIIKDYFLTPGEKILRSIRGINLGTQQAIQKVYRQKVVSRKEPALIYFKYKTKGLGVACRSVQPMAPGLHEAQDSCECGKHKIINLLKTSSGLNSLY